MVSEIMKKNLKRPLSAADGWNPLQTASYQVRAQISPKSDQNARVIGGYVAAPKSDDFQNFKKWKSSESSEIW